MTTVVALGCGLVVNCWAQPGQLYNYTINTAIGTYPSGDGGAPTAALLGFPEKMAVSADGSVYFADTYNHRIRKVSGGKITTVAGTGAPGFSGDGSPAASAQLFYPAAVALDATGNLYIYDTSNQVIRKVDTGGNISTVAGTPGTGGVAGDGGPATAAKFSLNFGGGLAVDSRGDLYIADLINCAIRKVTLSGARTISTVAGVLGQAGSDGDGKAATTAHLFYPTGIAFDSKGNLYIADSQNHVIRMVSAADQSISTVAGTIGQASNTGDGGSPTAATLVLPYDIAVDGQGNFYIADAGDNKIRKVTVGGTAAPTVGAAAVGAAAAAGGTISTFAGTGAFGYAGDGGAATSAVLLGPYGVAVDASSSVYIADTINSRIRVVRSGTIGGFAGADHNQGDGGKATDATLYFPAGMAWDKSGNLYIADQDNYRVRKVTTDGKITTIAGNGSPIISANGGAATATSIGKPLAVAVDSKGTVYIATANQVLVIDSKGNISPYVNASDAVGFTGDGQAATAAELHLPQGLAIDSADNLYIADTYNHRIRKVTADRVISTVAGSGPVSPASNGSFGGDGGLATAANLAYPYGIAFDNSGNLLIADTKNFVIRKVDSKTGKISTIAGTPSKQGFGGDLGLATAALLTNPVSVAPDIAGNLFITDVGNEVVRIVDALGVISTVSGNGKIGFSGDGGPAVSAQMDIPWGVLTDPSGNVWITDQYNHRVRKLTPSGPSVPSSNAVVNAASFVAGGIVPGGMASLFGSNLTSAKGINLASGLPLATDLLNSSVKFNNTVAAPIFAVDNVNGQQQINFQVPWELTPLIGQSVVLQVVNNGALGAPVVVPVLAAQPGVFAYNVGADLFGVVLHADFQLADSAHPLTAGEVALIYCTNLGGVAPAIADGVAGTGNEKTVKTPVVTIGGASAPVSFSGIAPGFVGLYQINVQIPAGLKSPNQPLLIKMGDATSKTVLVPVK